jgi:hypothetical protein
MDRFAAVTFRRLSWHPKAAKAKMSALRYVVLHHTGIDRPHYDLMFERDPHGALVTVRCSDWPPGEGTVFEWIGDHRRSYLDYEGPVPGNRGEVARVEAGVYSVQADRDDSLLLRLSSAIQIRIPNAGWDRE